MTELELESYCVKHPHCDCNCIKCHGFAAYQRSELGMDEREDDYETYSLKQEIMETTYDDIGF